MAGGLKVKIISLGFFSFERADYDAVFKIEVQTIKIKHFVSKKLFKT